FYYYLSKSVAETVKTELKVYFLRGDHLVVAKRGISLQASTSIIRQSETALKYLISGPTTMERIIGIFSEVPDDITVLGVRQEGSTLRVNFDSKFYDFGSGSAGIQAAIAQIVYTLTELKTINSIQFLIEGQERELIIGKEGYVIDRALSRKDINI
ncbi:MAG: GerMN domain-containing protein, partial [Candidatus Margulisiibacteriota bacterium]